jgi:hypothetical protein
MSKDAAMRAMREARYNERSTAVSRPATRVAGPTKTPTADPVAPASSADGLCGHRSMNGRSCTREQGHAAKSHRYS